MRTCLLFSLLWAGSAQAFCGFYVGGADDLLYNSATQVVLMREGDRTALSMQNDYQGPPKDFALVVPVPVVVKAADVKTLPADVFARVDRLAAPRLVEYWERDPCHRPSNVYFGSLGTRGVGSGGGGYGRGAGRAKVRVEAAFAAGEYQIVVLAADESAALDAWLRAHRYNIPKGAEAALAPYVAAGMKFFVAKVNPEKVTFRDGRAVLSPLRVVYRSKDLRLPVRLGLLNAGEAQDLVVHVLARDQRYEVANYPNVTIPTNLDVAEDVRDRFPQFYAALFDETLRHTPGAVVTEYAWQATTCDPCPGPVLSAQDLATLGADALLDGVKGPGSGVGVQTAAGPVEGGLTGDLVRRVVRRHAREVQYCAERAMQRGAPMPTAPVTARFFIKPDGGVRGPAKVTGAHDDLGRCLSARLQRWRFPRPKDGEPVRAEVVWTLRPGRPRLFGRGSPLNAFVLTRLHARYGKTTLGEDLVFRPAKPIVGGREVRGPKGLETGATVASFNNFQGRYAIRHRWTGPVDCRQPRYGVWGGPPRGSTGKTGSASGLPPERAPVDLAKAVPAGIPALKVPARE